ncbi:hypothetical protein SeLEV6574_g02704 [Synchytrium endobioticum]|uniref:Large ribosomal subunit protein bL33m n=1 Tax=Synchytrium endobioticum TaxID=286115 RepID=A0A507D915_9FUNG|nr:hypothetical protein SeLEV6574_g02704 [Synchytrium endobioticum]
MAKGAKSRTVLVRLVSTAGTGFGYTTVRRRALPKLQLKKFDPIVNQHVLFVEGKLNHATGPSERIPDMDDDIFGQAQDAANATTSKHPPTPTPTDIHHHHHDEDDPFGISQSHATHSHAHAHAHLQPPPPSAALPSSSSSSSSSSQPVQSSQADATPQRPHQMHHYLQAHPDNNRPQPVSNARPAQSGTPQQQALLAQMHALQAQLLQRQQQQQQQHQASQAAGAPGGSGPQNPQLAGLQAQLLAQKALQNEHQPQALYQNQTTTEPRQQVQDQQLKLRQMHQVQIHPHQTLPHHIHASAHSTNSQHLPMTITTNYSAPSSPSSNSPQSATSGSGISIAKPEKFKEELAKLPPDKQATFMQLAHQFKSGQITPDAFKKAADELIYEMRAAAATSSLQAQGQTLKRPSLPSIPVPNSTVAAKKPKFEQHIPSVRPAALPYTQSQYNQSSQQQRMPVPMGQFQLPQRVASSSSLADEARARISVADRSKAQLDQELDATHAAGIEEEEEEQRLRSDMVLSEGSGPGHPRPGEDRIRNQAFMGVQALRGIVQDISSRNKVMKVDADYLAWLGLATEARVRELLESMVIVAKHRTAGLNHLLPLQSGSRTYMEDGGSRPLEVVVIDEPQRLLLKATKDERQKEMAEREQRGTGPNGDGTGVVQDADLQDGASAGKKKKDKGMKRKDYTDEYVATQQKGTLAKTLGFNKFSWMQTGSDHSGAPATVTAVPVKPPALATPPLPPSKSGQHMPDELAGAMRDVGDVPKDSKGVRLYKYFPINERRLIRLRDGLLILETEGARGVRNVVQKWSVRAGVGKT